MQLLTALEEGLNDLHVAKSTSLLEMTAEF